MGLSLVHPKLPSGTHLLDVLEWICPRFICMQESRILPGGQGGAHGDGGRVGEVEIAFGREREDSPAVAWVGWGKGVVSRPSQGLVT